MKCQKKDRQLLRIKLTEKIPDPCNPKEHYKSFAIKKNTKSVKKAKVITQQPKTYGQPNIVDIKPVIIEHSKTSPTPKEVLIGSGNLQVEIN